MPHVKHLTGKLQLVDSQLSHIQLRMNHMQSELQECLDQSKNQSISASCPEVRTASVKSTPTDLFGTEEFSILTEHIAKIESFQREEAMKHRIIEQLVQALHAGMLELAGSISKPEPHSSSTQGLSASMLATGSGRSPLERTSSGCTASFDEHD